MADRLQEEMRDLLIEIRNLLVPVVDSYLPAYEEKQRSRATEHRATVTALLSTDKRRAAWKLADGSMTQREIARRSQMDEGGASKFFKSLRELHAIVDDPNPKRALETD